MTGNEKSIVENTLLQIKAVEEAISENAKGILASTMKEEISELVRESLSGSKKSKRSLHEDEEGIETSVVEDENLEDGMEDEMEDDTEMANIEMGTDNEGDIEMDAEVSVDDNQEMPPLDMTQSPMSDVLKVFKAMGDEDGIIVKRDGNFLHISDNETNKDYMVQLEESKRRRKMKSRLDEEILYELSFEDKEMKEWGMAEFEKYSDQYGDPYDDSDNKDSDEYGDSEYSEEIQKPSPMYELQMDEDEEGEYGTYDMYEQDEDEYSNPEMYEQDEDEYSNPEMYEQDEEDQLPEMYETFKPKGRVGKMKFKYPSKLKRGVAETAFDKEMEEEWNEEEDKEELMSPEKGEKGEKSEAARTYGKGSKEGRGLRKGITPNRNFVYGKNGVQKESVNKELNLLREKNEEYKKALDFFRNKLNEVAVFNSNLAYSTRLFTEHSTTKQEKINILRRFDNVESLKESKNLYKTIKNELDGNGSNNVVKESITERVVKTPQTGSATNLIESKTYENPQFVRMKDLMAKIK